MDAVRTLKQKVVAVLLEVRSADCSSHAWEPRRQRARSYPRHGMTPEDKEWEAPFFAPPRVAPDVPAVLAFAAALQAHLGTIVTACLFAPAGGGQNAEFPCALVTVEPFSPGGLRRLALNARSELVNQAAAAYVKGVTHASRDRPSAAAFGRRQTPCSPGGILED